MTRPGALWLVLGLTLGGGGGYLAGTVSMARFFRGEIQLLLSLPEPSALIPTGEFYATRDPPVLWNKVGHRMLAFRPLPTSTDTAIVQMFADRPAPPVVEQVPASKPSKRKKESKR